MRGASLAGGAVAVQLRILAGAFNDCGFRSIHKFLKYFPKHRQYEELDVGLKPDFTGANPLFTAIRRATGRSNQDRYFRKLSDWEPPHNFFKSF